MKGAIARALLAVSAAALLPGTAWADQPQDWVLAGPQEEGTSFAGDFVLGAVVGTLQHDTRVYGKANQLTLFTKGTAAVPFGTVETGFDMRIVVLSLGASAGLSRAWRGLSCDAGQACTRQLRREKDYSGDFNPANIAFAELRAQLFLPFNDYVTGVGQLRYRFSNQPNRMYDYGNGVVHDGEILRGDFMVFIRNREFGAFAPTLQVLNFSEDATNHTQWNFGFTFLTRAGLINRDDVFVWRMLFHNSDVTGGYDNSKVFGTHLWRGPFTLLLAYRTVIAL